MIILVGKTASGKDSILNELITKYGYKKLITYTTRDMRKDEQQDITYHFISEEEFKKKIEEGFFAEWKSYNTKSGIWYYGTALEDLKNAEDNTVIILTPNGYRDIINKLSDKPKSIYIYANNSTIKKRLIKRGDDKEEAKRRLEHDNADFKGIENDVDRIVYNNDGMTVEEVTNNILKWIRGRGIDEKKHISCRCYGGLQEQ